MSIEEIKQKLLLIENKIMSIYEKLQNLELQGLMNSNEYNELLIKLKELLKNENDLILMINSPEQLQNLLELLATKEDINSFSLDLKTLISKQRSELIIRRAVIKVFSFKQKIDLNNLKQMGVSLEQELKENGENIKISRNKAYYGLLTLLVISIKIKEDFLNTLNTLIAKNELDNDNYLYLKYMLSYLFPIIEEKNIQNCFQKESILYWQALMYKDYTEMSEESFTETKNCLIMSVISILHDDSTDIETLIWRVVMLFCDDGDIAKLPIREEVKNQNFKDKEIPLKLRLKQ